MQIKLKLVRLRYIYIYLLSLVLFLIFFSATFTHAKTFKVSNLEISQPFLLNFDKNDVIDHGFKMAFANLISMIATSNEKKKIKKIPLNVIKGLIDYFVISNERFVNETYFARLDVSFNKRNILYFLEKQNIFPSIPVKNKVLLIPIIIDSKKENVLLFSNNNLYKKWNENKIDYHLLNYLLPSEDLEDLGMIQKNFNNIENYDFKDLIKKYALEDHIILIIFKKENELRVLSKINFNNILKIDNEIFSDVNLDGDNSLYLFIEKLKIKYEDKWKENNQINTSIKLPILISINSKKYLKILALENALNNLDFVSNFSILSFNSQNCLYKIIYNGSTINFLNDMKKMNFDVITEKKIWKIK